jgi:outer membrane protein assembly factor BamB
MTRRTLAVGAAIALSLVWMPAASAAAGPAGAVEPGWGDWPQFHGNAAHTGYNAAENRISATNVARLRLAWKATDLPGSVGSSPAVANGVVYIPTGNELQAYSVDCASGGETCSPLWVGGTATDSTPDVSSGVVYVRSGATEIHAFGVDCASGGKTCTPIWSGTSGGGTLGVFANDDLSPTVSNGIAYVASGDITMGGYAVGCASGGQACQASWNAYATGTVWGSAAIDRGVVYFGGGDKVYAFAAKCAGVSGTCSPLWTGDGGSNGSPAVADGVVYVASGANNVDAYAVGCASGGQTCAPLWTATTEGLVGASPAIANGVVYVGASDGKLYAFAAAGCGRGGGTCSPLWTGTGGGEISSPVVANGVVYAGSTDGNMYAFAVGCGSHSQTCAPLWVAKTGGPISGSPAVANGAVYFRSDDGNLYAYSLDGTTPPTSTVTPGSASESGVPTWPVAFGLAAFLVGTLITLSRSRTGA